MPKHKAPGEVQETALSKDAEEVDDLVERPVAELSRRERRKLQLRDEILDAALDLFAEKDFYAVTMQEVADRVEVGVGTLYNFFASKEDLYEQLVLEHARSLFVVLQDQLADRGRDTLELVSEYVACGWRLLSSDSRVLKLYLAVTQGARFSVRLRLDPEIKQNFDLLTDDLASLMDRAVEEKLFRPVGGRNLALMLQGISHSFFLEWIRNPDPAAVDSNVAMILDLFCHGALAAGTKDQPQSD